MARMSLATSTKKADPTGPLRRSRPNRTPGGRRRAGMLSRRLYDGVGESLDHRGARTLLVVKPESPRELSSALTGRLEISTATTIRHSQPAELDLVEQGGRFSPRGPTRPPAVVDHPAVVASARSCRLGHGCLRLSGRVPGPWKRRNQAVRERKTSVLRACRVPNPAKRLNVMQRPKTLFEP